PAVGNLPRSCGGLRNRAGPGTSNRVSRQVIAATGETADDYTPRLTASPGLLWHPEPSPGQRTSDAGLLPVRPSNQRIGLTQAFADALDDPRDPERTGYTFLERVRARVYGILAG